MKINELSLNILGKSTYPNGIVLSTPTVLTGGEIKDCSFTNVEPLNSVDLSNMTISGVQVKVVPIFN